MLLALAVLDWCHFWLPDKLTLPLIALGVACSILPGLPSIIDSLIGAAAGYLIFALIGGLYRRIRGRSGLGGGDAKLLAAAGAWLGWQLLPLELLIASLAGLLYAAAAAVVDRRWPSASDRVPFGAMLALAAWLIWLARAQFAALFVMPEAM